MKTLDEILELSNTRLWDDDKTLDVCIKSELPFIEIILSQKCLRCDDDIINGNEKMLKAFNQNINGMKIQCKSCEQSYFISKFIKF